MLGDEDAAPSWEAVGIVCETVISSISINSFSETTYTVTATPTMTAPPTGAPTSTPASARRRGRRRLQAVSSGLGVEFQLYASEATANDTAATLLTALQDGTFDTEMVNTGLPTNVTTAEVTQAPAVVAQRFACKPSAVD
ncbi:hypothetical protein CYMTET_18572 [Cymbomonas tetramitiformis]|uniref:Uncharacterized protein n=1 Tax=Cymbomonas tetramitiformis TaxID=36881 RepID=A0AAE0G898_9CHLO|nr:hypothetical protein CYMTET_18572 [Cymbomonas tetramitiformis]